MITKDGLKADIRSLTTMWGAGNPALFTDAKAHEDELINLLCKLVDKTPSKTIRELGKGYDTACKEYEETINETPVF